MQHNGDGGGNARLFADEPRPGNQHAVDEVVKRIADEVHPAHTVDAAWRMVVQVFPMVMPVEHAFDQEEPDQAPQHAPRNRVVKSPRISHGVRQQVQERIADERPGRQSDEQVEPCANGITPYEQNTANKADQRNGDHRREDWE